MHRFLRAIGFSDIMSRQNMDKLLGIIMNQPDKKKKTEINGKVYTEMSKEFGHNIGITIRGEYDKLGFFHLEHHFPYCSCNLYTGTEDIVVNKRVDTDAYTGMCDDIRMGISMIFYLQNAVDYVMLHVPDNTPHKAKLSLSGLSLEAKVILGVERSEQSLKRKNYETHLRKQLIKQAKNGDQDALDSLTVDEMDLNTRINRRIKKEDLYSLVETSFVPYGSESDNYSLLGNIINWNLVTNEYTHEEVYHILVNCNDIVVAVSINKKDLLGTPMVGCRFKGAIWMQGYVDFQQIR